MTAGIYVKDAGAWVLVPRPYTKDTGAWKEPAQVWVKNSGTWVQVYQEDNTPPPAPQLTLTLTNNRYIMTNVKAVNTTLADLSKVLVLVSSEGFPSNQYSSGFVSTPTTGWPNEAWSEFKYNVTGGHVDTTAYDRAYPPNATSASALSGGKTYYFGAWSVDNKGNWSSGTFRSLKMPDRIGDEPGTPIQTKVTEWVASFSQCFNGADNLRWNGVNLYQGYWNNADGAQESIIGFNSANIVSTLKTATILKVEVYMYCQKAYNNTTGALARFLFHGASAPQPTLATVNRFGTHGSDTFHTGDGHWFDITALGTAGWKSGAVKGLTFQPNTFDRHYSALFDGNTQAHPPRLRITYQPA